MGEEAATEDATAGTKGKKVEKLPPDGYVCRLCSVPGHWIQVCPTKKTGKSSIICIFCFIMQNVKCYTTSMFCMMYVRLIHHKARRKERPQTTCRFLGRTHRLRILKGPRNYKLYLHQNVSLLCICMFCFIMHIIQSRKLTSCFDHNNDVPHLHDVPYIIHRFLWPNLSAEQS